MLYRFALRTEPTKREILPEAFSELSYLCAYTDINRYHHGFLNWHWHDIFEVDYVKEGSLELLLPEEKVVLHQGDVLFINSGVLHAKQSLDRENCETFAHMFSMEFLSGIYNSPLERKYILPIRESGMQIYRFSADSPRRLQMSSAVLRAVTLCDEEPFGYEFDLRSELSSFWKNLFLETESLREGVQRHNVVDVERIKRMIDFIQTHYAQRVTLDDIAAEANISTRECSRCFQRCLGMTPIQYVNRCRLQAAADMLLNTGESILTISEACGFSSPGYFSRTFKEALGCTPREYRTSGSAIMQKAD